MNRAAVETRHLGHIVAHMKPVLLLQPSHFFPPFLLFIGCFLNVILFVTFLCLLLAIWASFASRAFFISVLLLDRVVAPSASTMAALSASVAREQGSSQLAVPHCMLLVLNVLVTQSNVNPQRYVNC